MRIVLLSLVRVANLLSSASHSWNQLNGRSQAGRPPWKAATIVVAATAAKKEEVILDVDCPIFRRLILLLSSSVSLKGKREAYWEWMGFAKKKMLNVPALAGSLLANWESFRSMPRNAVESFQSNLPPWRGELKARGRAAARTSSLRRRERSAFFSPARSGPHWSAGGRHTSGKHFHLFLPIRALLWRAVQVLSLLGLVFFLLFPFITFILQLSFGPPSWLWLLCAFFLSFSLGASYFIFVPRGRVFRRT